MSEEPPDSGAFTATVASKDFLHQVSNCVGVILGNTDLALMELPEDHTARELLQEVRDSARRLKDLLLIMRDGESGPPPERPPHTTKVKIACVDDDEAFLTLSSRALRKLGHEMVEFSNAESAWRVISASPDAFDLVIVDKGLSGQDGLEVAAEWLRQLPQLPLCLTSGYVDEEFEKAAKNAGLRRVLRKPNTMDEFARSIQSLLETFTRQ